MNIRVIATTNASLGAMVEARPVPQRSVLPAERYSSFHPSSSRSDRGHSRARKATSREQFATETGTETPLLDPDFVQKLQEHTWPGNIRELANFMRRVLSLNQGARIDAACFHKEFRPLGKTRTAAARMPVPGTPISVLEKIHFENTLALVHGNRTHAAEYVRYQPAHHAQQNQGIWFTAKEIRMTPTEPSSVMLETYLRLAATREKVISSNMANIDTPGFGHATSTSRAS